MDLFRTFERDKDNCVSREQFIAGLKKALVCTKYVHCEAHINVNKLTILTRMMIYSCCVPQDNFLFYKVLAM